MLVRIIYLLYRRRGLKQNCLCTITKLCCPQKIKFFISFIFCTTRGISRLVSRKVFLVPKVYLKWARKQRSSQEFSFTLPLPSRHLRLHHLRCWQRNRRLGISWDHARASLDEARKIILFCAQCQGSFAVGWGVSHFPFDALKRVLKTCVNVDQ